MAWQGEWAKALEARDKLLLGEDGWKGLLQAGKGNLGPRDTPCAPWPWPCSLPLYGVPLSVSLCLLNDWTQGCATAQEPLHGQTGLRGHQQQEGWLCPSPTLKPGQWCRAQPALPRPCSTDGPRSGQDRGSVSWLPPALQGCPGVRAAGHLLMLTQPSVTGDSCRGQVLRATATTLQPPGAQALLPDEVPHVG